MRLIIDNQHISLKNVGGADIIRDISEQTSYKVAGYYFAPSYQSDRWDGTIKLLRFTPQKGYYMPAGLVSVVLDTLKSRGITPEVIDQRIVTGKKIDVEWKPSDLHLRYYQEQAVNSITDDIGLQTGKGMLKLPVRSGKTIIAAAIINKVRRNTLFVVNSEILLNQTIKLFENIFKMPIGMVGQSIWKPNDITVATVQTLVKRSSTSKCRRMLRECGVLFVDEIHHLKTADKWRDVLIKCPAFYRIGLSATININPKKENTKGAIWMRAVTGPILYEKTISELAEQGYLIKPDIFVVPVKVKYKGKYRDSYQECIVYNIERNKLIISIAKKCSELGLRVLIHTQFLRHIKELYQLICGECEIMYGDVPPDKRREIIQRFKDGHGKSRILIGTVFHEAIDIPECEVVINAEAGADDIATLQKLRNLTAHKDKKVAWVFDFAETGNKYFSRQALRRIKTYKKESAFKIRVLKKPIDFLDELGYNISFSGGN